MPTKNTYIDKIIGNYRVVTAVASNTTSTVYMAQHILLPKSTVAIKLFQTAFPPNREQFFREVRLLKMLKHPHILPILEVGVHEDHVYLVSEYAAQGTLRDRVRRKAPARLPAQECITILTEIADALAYAHHFNIAHGNMKPENILFNAEGDALLTDFSWATISSEYSDTVQRLNTLRYWAPEQFQGTTTWESDQYALACIAYELFTGQPPFSASNPTKLEQLHLTEKPLAPTQLNLLAPPPVEQAILKALAKRRSERFPNVKELAAALAIPALPLISPSGQTFPRHLTQVEKPQPEEASVDKPALLKALAPLPLQAHLANMTLITPDMSPEPEIEEPIALLSPAPAADASSTSANQAAAAMSALFQETLQLDLSADALPAPGAILVDRPLADTPTQAMPQFLAPSPLGLQQSTSPPATKTDKPHDGRRRLLLIGLCLLLIAGLLASILVLQPGRSPSTQRAVISLHPTATAPAATLAPSPTATATSVPTPTPRPTPKPTPRPTPRPTPKPPTPLPGPAFSASPQQLQANASCPPDHGGYRCTVTVSLAASATGSVRWNAFASNFFAFFNPSRGNLSPGQQQQVIIYISSNRCPLKGNLIFTTTDGKQLMVAWQC